MDNQLPNHSFSLKSLHTFGVEAFSNDIIPIHSIKEFLSIFPRISSKKYMFLGGGSNVLFTQYYEGTILLNQLKGIEITSKNEDFIEIECASGENWHQFVLFALQNGAFGLENLSLIPGSVGAAPMQNIGAYGSEIKHWCTFVEGIALHTLQTQRLLADECQFGYRESIFKHELKNKFFITKVGFRLHTARSWQPNISYGDIQKILTLNNINSPTPHDISKAVIEIRQSKLPDPAELGNAGSFFKNPVINASLFEELVNKFPEIPHYPDPNGIKIPAGWLIEQAGFKGKQVGQTGCHQKQALVIVNYGNATGKEIYDFSESIIQTIHNLFGITLQREVNII